MKFQHIGLCSFLLMAACTQSDSGSSGPDASVVFAQNLNSSLIQAGGQYAVKWSLPYGGGPLSSSTNYLIATQNENMQADCTAPIKITPVTTSLSFALPTPQWVPSQVLVNGQIVPTSANGTYLLSCLGNGQFKKDYLSTDNQTVLYSVSLTNYTSTPLSGMLENSPADLLQDLPFQDAIAANYFPANAKWNVGSAYIKHQTQFTADTYFAEPCINAQTGQAADTCLTGVLEDIFPYNDSPNGKPSELDQLSDGTISTIQGLRMWIATAARPETNGTVFRSFFELGGNVYAGELLKQGTTEVYAQADGSLVNYIIELNSNAVLTVANSFISAGALGSDAGSDAPVGQCLDLFGIGGHGINGSLAPQDLLQHYAVPTGLTGSGQTIALVDGPSTADLLSDLNVMSAYYGLPILGACPSTTGPCFQHIDLTNGAAVSADQDWGAEPALDLQAAHAVAPSANLLLVTAASDNWSDMMIAIQTAASAANVSAVSMSFGYTGSNNTNDVNGPAFDAMIAGFPGVVFLASTGDSGASGGPGYPAASPLVTAVGGTRIQSLTWTDTSSETAWLFTGGGIQPQEAMPSWQSNYLTSAETSMNDFMRAAPDVAADADYQHSPFAIYYKQRWVMTGGTSLSAPIWAGMTALIAQSIWKNKQKTLANVMTTTSPSGGGFNALLYAAKSAAGTQVFHDIVSGSNNLTGAPCALCNAGAGYNDVTGLGTPQLSALMTQLLTQVH